jgi:hypothetical protein
MGMRRRSRRRGLVAGAAIGHHMAKKSDARAQQASDDYREEPAQYAPPPARPG